jgi:predicted PurR-regulated permease PerM
VLEPITPILSDSQRRIVGSAVTLAAFLGSVALIILTFVAIGRLIAYFSNVLWPLAVAGVFALILHPLVHTLVRRMKMRRLTAVVLLYGIFLLLMGTALILLLPPLIQQLVDFVHFVPTLWENVVAYTTAHYPEWIETAQHYLANPTIRSLIDGLATEGKALFAGTIPTLRVAFGGAFDVATFFTHLAIIPVYLFFFLLMRGEPTAELGRHLPFLRPGVRNDVMFLTREFISIIESFFRGQLLIGLLMGVLFAIGFSLIGLKFGLIIGLVLGLLNIVPFLGSIIGIAVTVPLAFFQPGGSWQLIGLVLLVTIIVQCIESWVLTPKIMGHHTGLHPLVIIVAVFFWGTAFGGVLGMLLAVPLTAFFVTAWRLAKLKYFRPM